MTAKFNERLIDAEEDRQDGAEADESQCFFVNREKTALTEALHQRHPENYRRNDFLFCVESAVSGHRGTGLMNRYQGYRLK